MTLVMPGRRRGHILADTPATDRSKLKSARGSRSGWKAWTVGPTPTQRRLDVYERHDGKRDRRRIVPVDTFDRPQFDTPRNSIESPWHGFFLTRGKTKTNEKVRYFGDHVVRACVDDVIRTSGKKKNAPNGPANIDFSIFSGIVREISEGSVKLHPFELSYVERFPNY